MHPVLPQECTYHGRYVGHIKAHTIEATRQTTRMGQPPQMTLLSCWEWGFNVSRATPQQQWEIPAMFGLRMLQLQTFWQGRLNLATCFVFSLVFFCLFVNIVLNFYFYLRASQMQYLCQLKDNVKFILGLFHWNHHTETAIDNICKLLISKLHVI